MDILGNYADPGMEIEIALRKHDLPFEFSAQAMVETGKPLDKVRKSEWSERVDLRDLPHIKEHKKTTQLTVV